MTEIARLACRRCSQPLAIERGGVLFVGTLAFEQPVRLRCRICAHETAWLPPRVRPSPEEVATEPPETRTRQAVKGLWHKAAA